MANKPVMSFLTFLFLETLVIATLNFSFCNGSTYAGCIEKERQALLRLKQDLTDPSKRLASWIGDGDCCAWTGVVCNNSSGHIIELHLGNPLNRPTNYYASQTEVADTERSKLSGKINPSLLDFKHLIYLDLSGNDFEVQIPDFLGSLRNLRHLNLSRAGFVGMIPPQLGNLSRLQYLDLSHGSSDLFVENLMWLSGHSSLEHLDLSGVNLMNASDWLLVTNALPSLVVLQLSSCQLHHFPPLPTVNFSSLAALDLSNNQFDNSLIPSWIWGLNHLVFLDLSYNYWQGPIPDGLQNMASLRYLDLCYNRFMFTIPNWLSRLSHLEYLDLSSTSLNGLIPDQLGNLSNLQYLSLDQTYPGMLYVENFWWLSGLPLLEHLNLRGVDLSKASDHWLVVMNSLPSLALMQLSMCRLSHFPPLPNANFSSLNVLDLSQNQFGNSQFPSWVFGLGKLVSLQLYDSNFQIPNLDGLQNLTSLRNLALSGNHFNSSIPNWIYRCSHLQYLSLSGSSLGGTISGDLGNLTSIRELDLSFNELEGRIPKSLGGLCNLESLQISHVKLSQEISEVIDILSGCIADRLRTLDLSNSLLSGHLTNQLGRFKNLDRLDLGYNSISGPIPSSLGELELLRVLDLSSNKLEGTLTHIHFANLTGLELFSVSRNSLKLKVNPDWVPPFQLSSLHLGSCLLGPQFPPWLYSQKGLNYLDLSNSGIVDTTSGRFWEFLFQVDYINLSENQIHGNIPNLTSEVVKIHSLDLSSNNFSGPLPTISFNIFEINLSNNTFNGSVAHFLCHEMNEPKWTQILNLGDNALSGELPDCWMNWQYLSVLNLGNNKFSGKLPTSMGTLTTLLSLNLHKNSLSGEIPLSFGNCTKLTAFSIAENEFVGNIPTWIGGNFSAMKILNFRSNNFHGRFPEELCSVATLQILDLADNNLSGKIPRCIKNFSAMMTVNYSAMNFVTYPSYSAAEFVEDESLIVKGKEMEYHTTLNLLRFIDLSKNNFSGAIPVEVTSLGALLSLNLSYNSLTGSIPMNIGVMRSLESIDLSVNQLSGEIPESISNLTFLNHLNLANNKLIGRIPLSTQIQGFNASWFIGNELCGAPLPRNCTITTPPDNGDGKGHKNEVNWFYVSMGLGFVVGFWGMVGPLLFNRRWRFIYYRSLDHLGDKFFRIVRN